jgi:pimeloyl-ACP methyl ester carboxylesterase
MRQLGCLLFGIALFGVMQLSVVGQEKKADPKVIVKPAVCASGCTVVPSFRHLDGQTLVFVANAENSATNASDNLQDVTSDRGLRWTIKPIGWCRQNACYPDMADADAQLRAAHNLACWTAAIRRDAPSARILYVGHSAGARVVLAAAEMAGPGSVDRIVLMNASVSTCYDLHNALRASRFGIDSFYTMDDGCLETAEERHALSDGVRGRAAGRVGFRCPSDPREAELYRQLRQHPFTDDMHGGGGHCTFISRHTMKRVIVPMLASTPQGCVIEGKKMPLAK